MVTLTWSQVVIILERRVYITGKKPIDQVPSRSVSIF